MPRHACATGHDFLPHSSRPRPGLATLSNLCPTQSHARMVGGQRVRPPGTLSPPEQLHPAELTHGVRHCGVTNCRVLTMRHPKCYLSSPGRTLRSSEVFRLCRNRQIVVRVCYHTRAAYWGCGASFGGRRLEASAGSSRGGGNLVAMGNGPKPQAMLLAVSIDSGCMSRKRRYSDALPGQNRNPGIRCVDA